MFLPTKRAPSPPSVTNWSGIGTLPAVMAIRTVPPLPDVSFAAAWSPCSARWTLEADGLPPGPPCPAGGTLGAEGLPREPLSDDEPPQAASARAITQHRVRAIADVILG